MKGENFMYYKNEIGYVLKTKDGVIIENEYKTTTIVIKDFAKKEDAIKMEFNVAKIELEELAQIKNGPIR